MLPITTQDTLVEVVLRRRVFEFREVLRDFEALNAENPQLARYIAVAWETLAEALRRLGLTEEVAWELAFIGVDICIMLYTSLRRQAERDKLPPLPKVSESLADAFIERINEFAIKPPREMSKILERDPVLLRYLWIACDGYSRILEEEKLPREELLAIVYSAFALACGLYELLEEAEEAEELAKLLRR